MTFQQARKKAFASARALGEAHYVLGPSPTDGYWVADQNAKAQLWPDRKPVFTASPESKGRYFG